MVTYNGVLYVLGGYANGGTKANTVYQATPGVNGATRLPGQHKLIHCQ